MYKNVCLLRFAATIVGEAKPFKVFVAGDEAEAESILREDEHLEPWDYRLTLRGNCEKHVKLPVMCHA